MKTPERKMRKNGPISMFYNCDLRGPPPFPALSCSVSVLLIVSFFLFSVTCVI